MSEDINPFLDLKNLRNLKEFLRSRSLSAVEPRVVALLETFRADWPAELTIEQIAANYSSTDAELAREVDEVLAILKGTAEPKAAVAEVEERA